MIGIRFSGVTSSLVEAGVLFTSNFKSTFQEGRGIVIVGLCVHRPIYLARGDENAAESSLSK